MIWLDIDSIELIYTIHKEYKEEIFYMINLSEEKNTEFGKEKSLNQEEFQ